MKLIRSTLPRAAVFAVLLAATCVSGAYAVGEIGGKDIAKNAIRAKHVKNNGLTGRDVKDGSLKSKDFAVLPEGPEGPQGPQGKVGPRGPKGDAGEDGTSVFASTIPSGETVTGYFGFQNPLASGKTQRVGYSLPVPAPVSLSDDTVNFSPSAGGGENDASCTGSADNPIAPAGKLCLYSQGASGTGEVRGEANTPNGFMVKVTSNGGNDDFVGIRGTWAYTAP